MIDIGKPFGPASALLAVSAALHIVAVVLNLGDYFIPLILGALIWVGIVFSLQRGNRLFAMLAFIAAAFGGSIALGLGLSETGAFSITLVGIAVAEWSAAVLLFGALWRNPKAEPEVA